MSAAAKGYIYIAGYFLATGRSSCGEGPGRIDNDPNFWDGPPTPPTWGICRPDLRERVTDGDYVFFVSPRRSALGQTVFGYMQVLEDTDHATAFHRPELRPKRMRVGKNPNGNILVTGQGKYNRKADAGAHEHNFERIQAHYVIGNPQSSWFGLLDAETRANLSQKAVEFPRVLREVFDLPGERPIDIITRAGKEMNQAEVEALRRWVLE